MSTSLALFTRCSDQVVQFNANFDASTLQEHSKISLELMKEELGDLWAKTKTAYEQCMQSKSEEDIESVRGKYTTTFKDYLSCISCIGQCMEKFKEEPKADQDLQAKAPLPPNNLKLPPCDTDVFQGDYVAWPSFRDLFTAIYINNPHLSSVEKLCHLLRKTSGEAKEIVEKSPLTNQGFDLAWANLKATFENKRVLVNSQLKQLFALPVIRTESASALKNLQRNINGCIAALKIYEVNVTNWDPVIVFLCSNRLPESTLNLWEQTLLDKSALPEWSQMDVFLTQRHRSLESIVDVKSSAASSSAHQLQRPSQAQSSSNQKRLSHATNVYSPNCVLCPKQSHVLRLCNKFLKLSVNDRYSTVKKHSCCLNCLMRGHTVKDCKSSRLCTTCNSKHHTLLHRRNQSPQSASNGQNQGTSAQAFHLQSTSPNAQLAPIKVPSDKPTNIGSALLGTAMIHICHLESTYTARALIDSASEASFISDRIRNLLKLPYSKTNATISGVNKKVSSSSSKLCSFVLGSPRDSNLLIEATAFVLPQITDNLPSNTINASILDEIPKVPLADPNFLRSGPIDVLIGGDLYPKIMMEGVKRSAFNNLLAQETVFGWIVTGAASNAQVSCFTTKVSTVEGETIDKQLQRFWELEEVPKRYLRSPEDEFCEELFVKTTTRNPDGRYVVLLPFRKEFPGNIKLGSSRPNALRQFVRNESRLQKTPGLKTDYDNVVKEYMELGHMERVAAPSVEHFPAHFYLPHHSVFKPESTSTKLRVVFNASSKSSNGVCLNDVLYTGPTLQSDLTMLLLRYRIFKFVFSSDIQKMYRQIQVHPDHRPYQRILFRSDTNSIIEDYQLNTVTFGVNCAPYLAIRTLRQLAEDCQDSHPLAAKILKDSMYVDDVLASYSDLPTALRARNELIDTLESAGFLLRKWSSNSKNLLIDLPKEHILDKDFLEFDETSNTKALGIRWNARLDHFYFIVQPLEGNSYTKREVLSAISKLFDPAGWLAPIVITAKIIMQQVWKDATPWDKPLNAQTLSKWKEFVENHRHIGVIKIPRWVEYTDGSSVEIHAFCDASEKAYAGVLYLRVSNDESTSCNLLLAKTKVAPLKTTSLPRLELCGALLMTEMLVSLMNELPIWIGKVYCWTDSTIVLSWLKKPPYTWTTFVANRVAKIQEKTRHANWRHVDSHDNPADLGSRGVSPQELSQNDLWWHGPLWLRQDHAHWPSSDKELDDVLLEARKINSHASQISDWEDPLGRFSSLPRALRVLSYVFRFVLMTQRKTRELYTFNSKTISGAEIARVRERLIILSQRRYFSEEYHHLSLKIPISKKSKLLNLNPFLDSNGVLRANGRLVNSLALSFNEKHPMLLPYGCTYSRLLISFIHQISLHGANQLVLRMLRQQYWIPKAKTLIKAVIHQCKVCVIHKKKEQSQIMAPLPEERTSLSRPFQNTGVDFAGPFDIKSYRGRGCVVTKGYVCLFVCFSTKAIHLEATSDLSTETFLAAFSRFVSRRSCPKQIFSDNGTNFVGASAVLKNEYKTVMRSSQEAICKLYSQHEIVWNFIPAGAPHMGGLWEAGVKSFKFHFRRVGSSHKYTFEEFQTLLARIEACLNSRPISPISTDVSDCAALTPGHFLTGGPILAIAEPMIEGNPISILNRWQKMKALSQQISLRWKEEYLKELHKRYKWKFPQRDLVVGDLVVVRHENLPPHEWRLGRIIKVYHGTDRRTRVADIFTQKGEITRPIVKLVAIPN